MSEPRFEGDVYRALFEHLPDGCALHEIVLDDAGRPVDYVFLEINSAFEQQTGLARAQVVGRRVTEVLPGIQHDPADWIGTYGRVALGGGTLQFQQRAEPLGRWYEVTTFSPRRGQFAVIFRDVTAQRDHELERERLLVEVEAAGARQEEAATAAEQRAAELEASFEATHAQIALLDREMRFVRVNNAYVQGCGQPRERLIGRGHFEMFPNEENERIFRGVARTGEPYFAVEKAFEFKDQPERGTTWWNWSVVPIRGRSGAVEAVLLSLLEVTAQVLARKKLEREAQMRERFIAILGHDLRQPMSVIHMSASSLLRRPGLEEKSARGLDRILRAIIGMESLIRTLLEYSRLQSTGQIPIQPTEFDLVSLLEREAEDVRTAFPTCEVVLDVESRLRGRWDEERLGQVVGNLLTNAAKYGDPSSPVTVRARSLGEQVRLEVHNRGEPIAPEALDSIFEPFLRARGPNSGSASGLGLGLYIVREIVRAHGGTIEVASTAESGTTFAVLLPASAERTAERGLRWEGSQGLVRPEPKARDS